MKTLLLGHCGALLDERNRLTQNAGDGGVETWPEALEALTGQKEMDARAMVDYFAPLKVWLDEQNAGRTIGW